MRTFRVAVVGFGNLGRSCALAASGGTEFALAGIVRRRESLEQPLPQGLHDVAVAAHIDELGPVDAALLCVPPNQTLGVAEALMQHRVPVVECARFHGEAFENHKATLGRIARVRKATAVVGAGWDPGALSVFRELFALLAPHGHTEISRRPGISLHHSTLAGTVDGVKEALCTELRAANGALQRYVYVELEPGADAAAVEARIRNDPLFLGEETLVFPVASIAELEEEGQGIVLERRGAAAAAKHQLLLLEARFSEAALAAQVMLSAVRALPGAGHRAYSLLDLPLGALWGNLRLQAEQEWA